MRKKIPKGGYRVLAIVWTLAAAAMAVAFVRRLAEFNLLLLLLLVLSVLTASNYWKLYRKTPGETARDFLRTPPRFSGRPVLFDSDPQTNDSEENTHE